MAMNGINFPLAFNGQEAIWQQVSKSKNVDRQEWYIYLVLGCPHYILRMTDPDRDISSMSEGKK